jgi:hypothetical protein
MMDANTYEFYGENIRVVEEDRKQRGQERSKDRIRQIVKRGRHLKRVGET